MMKFDLDGLSNIHVQDAAAPDAEPFSHTVKYRKVTRSPAEELAARVARFGTPEALPNALAAILMAHRDRAEVKPNGIKIVIDKKPYRYWHEDSVVCGKPELYGRVLYVRAIEHLDCIHVLDNAGKYIETLPLAATPDWYSKEAAEEKRKTRLVADRMKAEIVRGQSETMLRKTVANRETRETLQSIHSLPTGIERRAKPVEGNLEDLMGAMDRTTALRSGHARAKAGERSRMARESGGMEELILKDRRAQAVEEEEPADLSELL